MTRRILFAIVGVSLSAFAGPARAMHQVEPFDLSKLAARAERIVVAKVRSRSTGIDPLGLPATVYRLRVERVLKGTAPRRLVVKQFGVATPTEAPRTGAVIMPIHGMPVYEPGERYVLFLYGTSDAGYTSPVGLDIGAFHLGADGTVVNGIANAGLLRDLSAGTIRTLTGGGRSITLRGLLRVTRGLAGRHHLRAVGSTSGVSHYQTVVQARPAPRPQANPGALFNGAFLRWDVPSAANPGGALAAIPWDAETGPLGSLTNAQAIAEVQAAFAKWTAPATTTVVVSSTPGSLGVDVDAVCPSSTCYLNWLTVTGNGIFGDGLSPIIFDSDGSITNAIFANPCAFGGIGGFTISGTTVEGFIVYDGAWLGGVCGSLTAAQFGSVFTHEVGHFLGLAHSEVNAELVANSESFGPYGVPPCASVEIMNSYVPGTCAKPNVLKKDDVVSISQLYPSASFASTTGTITGHVLLSDGSTPFDCANVILRNDADPFFDAFGAISGISKDFGTPPAGQPGRFRAQGVTAGANYIVGANQISAAATGGSGLTGLCTPPPTLPGPEDFYNGPDESANPSVDNPTCVTFVSASAGGTTSGIDIVMNSSPTSSAPCGAGGTTSTTTSTSSTTSSTTSTTTSTSTTSSTLPRPTKLSGKKLRVKDKAGDATKRTIVFLAQDPGILRADFNPTVTGATLHVFNSAGGLDSACLPLPNTNWVAKGSSKWVYKDSHLVAGPVKAASIKNGLLKVVAKGSGPTTITYTLDEPAQQSVAVVYTDPAGDICWNFGGTIVKDSGTNPPNPGGAGQFSAKVAAAPVSCPVPPVTCP